MTYNYDFIEVVDNQGMRILVNTSQILTVRAAKWSNGIKTIIGMTDSDSVVTDEPYESLKERIICQQVIPDEGEK